MVSRLQGWYLIQSSKLLEGTSEGVNRKHPISRREITNIQRGSSFSSIKHCKPRAQHHFSSQNFHEVPESILLVRTGTPKSSPSSYSAQPAQLLHPRLQRR